MAVKDYFDEYPMEFVGPKVGVIATYILICLFAIGNAFNGWVAFMYLLVFLGAIYGGFARVACPSCFYFGKRCSTGTGLVAARLYKKGNSKNFEADYKKGAIIAYTVYLLPILFGFIGLITSGTFLAQLILLVLMLAVLMLVFVLHRKQACHNCYNKSFCPAGPGSGPIDIA